MKEKKALICIDLLLMKPIFTSEEAHKLGVSSANIDYYIKRGDVIRLERGVYKGAKAPESDDFRWDDLIIVVKKIKGGIICLTSALSLYELTDEIPRQHWIAISHNTRHRSSSNVKIIRTRNMSLGKTEIEIGGIKLPIFDRERTIVDAFRFLGKETAIKALKKAIALKGTEKLDLEKLHKYAKILRINIDAYIIAVTV